MRPITAVACVAVVALAGRATAGDPEKVFKPKNGRTLQGELVQETATAYIVRLPSGQTTLSKDAVLSVEDAPRVASPSPDPPTREAPTPPPPPAKDPSPAPPPPSPPPHPSSGTSEAPLATDAEIEAAKKVLATVPAPGTATDGERRAALDGARAKVPLATLVALAAQVPDHRNPVPERAVAVEIVQGMPLATTAPTLARALRSADLAKGVPSELVRLMIAVGPDREGLFARTAFAKAGANVARGAGIGGLEPLLTKVGGIGDVGSVCSWLLAPKTPRDALPAIASVAERIATRTGSPELALAPLATTLGSGPLPEWSRLTAAVRLLGIAKGSEAAARALVRVIDAVASHRYKSDEERAALDCAGEARDALAAVGGSAARERLIQCLRDAATESDRLAVLLSVERFRFGEDDPKKDLLGAIVDLMTRSGATDGEVALGARALGSLTGQRFGQKPEAWRRYVDSLSR